MTRVGRILSQAVAILDLVVSRMTSVASRMISKVVSTMVGLAVLALCCALLLVYLWCVALGLRELLRELLR